MCYFAFVCHAKSNQKHLWLQHDVKKKNTLEMTLRILAKAHLSAHFEIKLLEGREVSVWLDMF